MPDVRVVELNHKLRGGGGFLITLGRDPKHREIKTQRRMMSLIAKQGGRAVYRP